MREGTGGGGEGGGLMIEMQIIEVKKVISKMKNSKAPDPSSVRVETVFGLEGGKWTMVL